MRALTVEGRRRRDIAHDAAAAGWAKRGRVSRVSGLASAIRAIAGSRHPVPGIPIKVRQARHRIRLQEHYNRIVARTRPWDCRAADRSRYFPHQSDRELARRVRQMS